MAQIACEAAAMCLLAAWAHLLCHVILHLFERPSFSDLPEVPNGVAFFIPVCCDSAQVDLELSHSQASVMHTIGVQCRFWIIA